jgi:hypothetical protein
MRFLFLFLFLLLPLHTHAAVVISEIAWMGNTVSANDEWIELHNDGSSSVSLDGWKVQDGANLSIDLLGSIAGGEYAVLERTDDESAEGSAFLIYTGALANTGSTLKLVRSDGEIEDQVSGGENWEDIGGDNVTKETPQLTSSGWVTAKATPGKATPTGIVNEEDEEEEEDADDESGVDVEETDNTTTKSSGKNEAIELKVPDSELVLELSGPERVYVNQEVTYRAEAKGLGRTLLASLQYLWNFGDLETSAGKEVRHRFRDAGEYVVTLDGSFGKYRQVVRKNITVLPVVFALSKKSNGDLLLHNNAKYEVDVSGFTLSGVSKFVFPKNTIMRQNATIVVPKEKVGFAGLGNVVLRDQTNALLTSLHASAPTLTLVPVKSDFLSQSTEAKRLEKVILSQESVVPEEVANTQSNFTFVSDVASREEGAIVPLADATSMEVDTVAATQKSPIQSPVQRAVPYVLLCGVLGLGILAVFSSRFGQRI